MAKIGAVRVYFFPTANPKKVTIMLEECGLPYELHLVNIAKGEQYDPQFLQVSPNNRVPAIVDPRGPDGSEISIFESGAILQYLGDKTGRFFPRNERDRVLVLEWLSWQVAGLGPVSGQAHHFAMLAEKLPYAITRFANEVHRLYGVMNTRLRECEYLAGEYSIADMACYPWVCHHDAPGHPGLSDFPNLRRWFDAVGSRPAVKKGAAAGAELQVLRGTVDDEARKWMFNRRAREVGP